MAGCGTDIGRNERQARVIIVIMTPFEKDQHFENKFAIGRFFKIL